MVAEESGKFLIKEGGEAIRAWSLTYLQIMYGHLFFLCSDVLIHKIVIVGRQRGHRKIVK